MLTAKAISKQAQAKFSTHMGKFDVWNAGGYHVIEYDEGTRFKDRSVMTMRLNDLSLEEWMQEFQYLVDELEKDEL